MSLVIQEMVQVGRCYLVEALRRSRQGCKGRAPQAYFLAFSPLKMRPWRANVRLLTMSTELGADIQYYLYREIAELGTHFVSV